MLNIILSLFLGLFLASFFGYWMHVCFHKHNWFSKAFYNAHMNHHLINYPSTNFLSETYRDSGKDKGNFWFALAFSPIVAGVALLAIFGCIGVFVAIACVLGMAIWGLVNDYVHDQFHLSTTWLNRFACFKRWQELHYIHHLDMNLNYGIIMFMYDKIFKTFNNKLDNQHWSA